MSNSYSGKRILVCISGSIAAFKVAGWVSNLAKSEARVSVVMTKGATQFITPLTFAALSGEKVHTDMFDASSGESMAHILLGSEADLIIVAPATAQTIGRLALGLADDLLSTTLLATRAPVYICPAMNSRMYSHPATQRNLKLLKEYGYSVIDPDVGTMACREEGQGRLVEWEQVDDIFQKCLMDQDFKGKKILVTAGPTREPIDPARFLSNRSSGKMGFAIARAATLRGASVTLVAGPTSLPTPSGVSRINVQTAEEMHKAVIDQAEQAEIIIKSAAVSDYGPREFSSIKVKKENIDSNLELKQNPDILRDLGENKKKTQLLVGFAAESGNFEAEGRKKIAAKNLDMIAVNNINSDTSGFEVDTNQLLLITRDSSVELPFGTKGENADKLLDHVAKLHGTVSKTSK